MIAPACARQSLLRHHVAASLGIAKTGHARIVGESAPPALVCATGVTLAAQVARATAQMAVATLTEILAEAPRLRA